MSVACPDDLSRLLVYAGISASTTNTVGCYRERRAGIKWRRAATDDGGSGEQRRDERRRNRPERAATPRGSKSSGESARIRFPIAGPRTTRSIFTSGASRITFPSLVRDAS